MRPTGLWYLLSTQSLVTAYNWPARVPSPGGLGTWAPLREAGHTAIKAKYIVIFEETHTLAAHFDNIGHDLSGLNGFKYIDWLPGYTAILDDEDLDKVRPDPSVLLVETDVRVSVVEPHGLANASDLYSHHRKRYNTDVNSRAPYGLQMVGAGRQLATPVRDFGNYAMLQYAGLSTLLKSYIYCLAS